MELLLVVGVVLGIVIIIVTVLFVINPGKNPWENEDDISEKMLVVIIDDDIKIVTQDYLSNFKEGNILVIPETVKKITKDVLYPNVLLS